LNAQLHSLKQAIKDKRLVKSVGKVTQFFGLIIESVGPEVFLGELCQIHSSQRHQVMAEVVGIKNNRVLLMPHGDIRGIRLGAEVIALGRTTQLNVGRGLLGRVLNAFGEPLDGEDLHDCNQRIELYQPEINPLARSRIDTQIHTGVAVIDTLLSIGRGQRIGIFSGSGIGKSSLLGMISRCSDADVNIIALVGERGREAMEFVEENLDADTLKKSVVIVSTSDQSPLERVHAAYTATRIAEYYREQGLHVLLTMDSITRFAMAQREIGLSIGEPPTARGYTPTVFTHLPRLLERCGGIKGKGSITGIYTVLVEGDDLNEPVSDSVRAILDGHIVLSRDYANKRHFPAIDVLQSHSRLSSSLHTEEQASICNDVMKLLASYEKSRDMVELGVYQAGGNAVLDRAIRFKAEFDQFAQQKTSDHCSLADGYKDLKQLLKDSQASARIPNE